MGHWFLSQWCIGDWKQRLSQQKIWHCEVFLCSCFHHKQLGATAAADRMFHFTLHWKDGNFQVGFDQNICRKVEKNIDSFILKRSRCFLLFFFLTRKKIVGNDSKVLKNWNWNQCVNSLLQHHNHVTAHSMKVQLSSPVWVFAGGEPMISVRFLQHVQCSKLVWQWISGKGCKSCKSMGLLTNLRKMSGLPQQTSPSLLQDSGDQRFSIKPTGNFSYLPATELSFLFKLTWLFRPDVARSFLFPLQMRALGPPLSLFHLFNRGCMTLTSHLDSFAVSWGLNAFASVRLVQHLWSTPSASSRLRQRKPQKFTDLPRKFKIHQKHIPGPLSPRLNKNPVWMEFSRKPEQTTAAFNSVQNTFIFP